jgi:hypothetical protein
MIIYFLKYTLLISQVKMIIFKRNLEKFLIII